MKDCNNYKNEFIFKMCKSRTRDNFQRQRLNASFIYTFAENFVLFILK